MTNYIVRKMTNKLIEAMDEGVLDPRVLAEVCLQYMSEDDVADMAHVNDLTWFINED